jgi:hypothetical protein
MIYMLLDILSNSVDHVSYYSAHYSLLKVGTVSRITNTVLPLSDDSKAALLEIEQRVEKETQLINLLSDNLLYLTRVEEGRALTSRETSNTLQARCFWNVHCFCCCVL